MENDEDDDDDGKDYQDKEEHFDKRWYYSDECLPTYCATKIQSRYIPGRLPRRQTIGLWPPFKPVFDRCMHVVGVRQQIQQMPFMVTGIALMNAFWHDDDFQLCHRFGWDDRRDKMKIDAISVLQGGVKTMVVS